MEKEIIISDIEKNEDGTVNFHHELVDSEGNVISSQDETNIVIDETKTLEENIEERVDDNIDVVIENESNTVEEVTA